MANICYNYAEICHIDERKLNKIYELCFDEFLSVRLINKFNNKEYNYLKKWTDDDLNSYGGTCIVDAEKVSPNKLILLSESRWSPPVILYEYLEGMDFGIKAKFIEPLICFYGFYENGKVHSYMYKDDNDVPEKIWENLPCRRS